MNEKAGPAAMPPSLRRPGPRPPTAAAAPALVCPKCQGAMWTYVRGGIVVELCEDCRGIFLDKGELERLIDVEGGGWSGLVAEPVGPGG
jgi:hypothetical protein